MPDEDKTKAPPAEKTEEELGAKMSFIEHLEELRRRLIVSILTVTVCFFVIYSSSVDLIAYWFMKPLRDVVTQYGHGSFIYTSMAEGFMFNMKLAGLAALFVASPMLFYQFWAFVTPGLYRRERRYIGPLIFFSTFFFMAGAAFFYFIAFPMGAKFFAQFADGEYIKFSPKLDDTFSFVTMMVLAFGLIFELPLVAFFLARLRIINVAFLNKYRKYAILIIFILAAIFTPPDVLSQCILAFPMWALYELSVLIVWVFGPKTKKEEEEESE